MDTGEWPQKRSPGDSFRQKLSQLAGRVPSETETIEALGRVRELFQVFQDIRAGRNGMRREDTTPAKSVSLLQAVNRS